MSLTSEVNLMDLLFDKEDPSLNLDSLDKDFKNEFIDVDSKPSYGIPSDSWPCNPDDFLDSLLSLSDSPFEDPLLTENLANETKLSPASSGSSSPPAAIVSSSSSDSGAHSDVLSDVYSDGCSDQIVYDTAEDSGASLDLQMSPNVQESEESMPASPEYGVASDGSQLDMLDAAILNAGIVDASSLGRLQLKNNTAIINMNLDSNDNFQTQESTLTAQQLTLRPVKNWKRNGGTSLTNGRQMIRVTPMPSSGSSVSHPRSILLPLQDLKDVRTIKIVNASNSTSSNQKRTRCRPVMPVMSKGTPVTLLQVKPTTYLSTSAPAQSSSVSSSVSDMMQMSGDDSSDESSDCATNNQSQYPRVILSPEEKRLMEKEGVTLPTHYPLTKQEERELKRIRRKIRNKISAQDSRKRKKEYVDGLEDRVKQCTDENRELLKRLKVLQTHNETLTNQLQRLRAIVARGMTGGGSRAQPATCLMVLLLSLALVMVPNLRPGNNSIEDQELNAGNSGLSADSNKLPTLPGRSRTLLHSTAGPQLFSADSTDDLEFMEEEESKQILSFLGKRKSPREDGDSLLDHDYSPPSLKRGKFTHDPGLSARHFVDPDIDDAWPPEPFPTQKDALQLEERLETLMEQLLNNKTEKPVSTVVLPVSQEGR